MSTQEIWTALDNTRSTILSAYNSLDDLRASFEELSKSTATRLDKLQNSVFYADDSIRTLSARMETLIIASNYFNFSRATVTISALQPHETSPRESLQQTVYGPEKAQANGEFKLDDFLIVYSFEGSQGSRGSYCFVGEDLLEDYKASESISDVNSTIRNTLLRTRLLAAQPAPSGTFDHTSLARIAWDALEKFKSKGIVDGIVSLHTS
ncbi:hypothetical protein SCHPADRAFT_907207 [Schizopora paradoxa]|uniref:Uncharacterized protein n=1 Tax=Schizopora paradoxa TaxID=27342 RepID=A0A0H2RE31_9AGAM|nr:hypothetical protein SCHPADRAFT_907207 [Schizopora paradoxa]